MAQRTLMHRLLTTSELQSQPIAIDTKVATSASDWGLVAWTAHVPRKRQTVWCQLHTKIIVL